jgi:hypothetical protein
MNENRPKLSTKLTAGRRPTHGGFSFLATGKLPEHRRYILQYLTAARMQLIRDIGGSEENLSAQQIIIIDRIISKLGILRCIEEHVRETSIMKGHELAPALRASYLAYSNSLRLDLQALGIDKRTADEALDLGSYIREREKEKTERKAKDAIISKSKGKGKGPSEIVAPDTSEREVFKPKGQGGKKKAKVRAKAGTEFEEIEAPKRSDEVGEGAEHEAIDKVIAEVELGDEVAEDSADG